MAKSDLNTPQDPNFPDYVYTDKPLVDVFDLRTGGRKMATVFLGEWMKVIEPGGVIPGKGRVSVAFRGGVGFVNRDDLTRTRMLEIFFIDVGQGDSILIQTPDDRRILIDGGQSDDAYEFICNKYRLDKPDHFVDFEAVIATHCDADHTQGLLKVLADPRIAVKRFFHNGLFARTDKKQDPDPVLKKRVSGLTDWPKPDDASALTPLMRRLAQAIEQARLNLPLVAAKMQGVPRWRGRVEVAPGGLACQRLDAAQGYLPIFDAANKYGLSFEVLWPKADANFSYAWYGDAGKTVNGNSVVLRLCYGKKRILLTGDLNAPAMDDLLTAYPIAADGSARFQADVYKAAHHGSQHFSVSFLKAVAADAAVISSGDDRNDVYGHPRAALMGTITRYSRCEKPAVFCTELAACFSKLAPEERKNFREGKTPLYERAIQGIVHLRCDGERLFLGTVFGRRMPDDPLAATTWKWDVWPDAEWDE
jgi:beta-lactamase superfamily II metal-dependent hydrolase